MAIIFLHIAKYVNNYSGNRKKYKPTCNDNIAVYHYQERLKGNYARILAPPANVNTGELTANYENGILEVVFPKIEKQTKQGF
ncbi:MAG: Hsp20/alpha crystallin family protein [Eubacteriales bacterium]